MSEQMPSVGDLIQHINSLVWNGICSKSRGPQADMLGFCWSCSSRSIHRSNQRGFIITYMNHCPFMCRIEGFFYKLLSMNIFAFMNTFTMFSSTGLLSKCFVHCGSPVADQPPPYNQPPHPPIRTPVSSSSSSSSSNQKRSLNITSFIHNRQDFARPWELW